MLFRVHFIDGGALDVAADNPTAARDQARKQKPVVPITKVKQVRG